MKYIKKILPLVLILVAFGIKNTYATKGVVNTDGVRIRKTPSTSANIITVLDKSAKVEILEEDGEWYKVKYTENGTYEGYMSSKFINKEGNQTVATSTPAPTPMPTSEPIPTVETTPQEVPQTENTPIPVVEEPKAELLGEKSVNNEAKVYILPEITSSVKETIKKNTKINVQEIAGNFAYVNYDNKYGWIRKNLIQNEVSTGNEEVTNNKENIANTTEKVGYVSVTQAIVRKKPSTQSEMVTSVNLNSEVKIIGEENDFYKIKMSDGEYYIAKRLISDTKQQTTSRSSVQRQETVTKPKEEEKVEQPVVVEEVPNEVVENTEIVENTPVQDTVSTSGNQIAQMARSYLGYKYVYGGASPSTGFDCSGLVYYICRQLGYNVNRTADAQANNGVYVEKSNLQPGDLVFFSNYKTYQGIGHVGIYVGNGEFVHASTATTGVITTSLSQADYVRRYVTARRIAN